MYDVISGTEAPICTDPNTQEEPMISNNHVVWSDDRHGNFEIYLGELRLLEESAAAKQLLEDLQDDINDLPTDAFKPGTSDRQADLHDKIDQVIDKINARQYKEAYNKLTKDIKPKLDFSSKQTWLTAAQQELLTLIEKIETILLSLL
jgi:beta propeller repeat protein